MYSIYAPTQYIDKKKCLSSLALKLDSDGGQPTILGGNLNLVMNSEEKRGGLYVPDPSRDKLENIMVDHSLIDIKPWNGKFT